MFKGYVSFQSVPILPVKKRRPAECNHLQRCSERSRESPGQGHHLQVTTDSLLLLTSQVTGAMVLHWDLMVFPGNCINQAP